MIAERTPLYRRPRADRSRIFGDVWVGNLEAAENCYNQPGWTVIDVREDERTPRARNVVQAPLLGWDGPNTPAASPARLERACAAIDAALAAGNRVMVHCWMGRERSPLAVVHWLMTRHGMHINSAYDLLKNQRRWVLDRREWLWAKPQMGFAK